MKSFILILTSIMSCVISYAQNNLDAGMVDIQIADESNTVLVNVRTSLNDIIKKHKILVKLDDDARRLRNQLIDDNSSVIMQISNGERTGYEDIDSVITRMAIRLSLKEDKNSCYVNHIKVEPGKPYDDTNSGEEIIKNKNILEDRNIQRLVAYEVFERYFELKEGREEKIKLEKYESELWKSINNKYTALSFLPPVNQLRSHTSKGTKNGVAILAGYGISVSTFIISTNSYNANKRKFDNISVDLTESDKAREHYNGQMDICRGGQIASGILFVGTYIYGVANALANRNTYKKNSNVSFVPVTYDNGAGVALVYNF